MAVQTIEIEIIPLDQSQLNQSADWSTATIVAAEDISKTAGEQSVDDSCEIDATRQRDVDPNSKLSRAQVASKLLEDLDSWTVEGSEPCPDWSEEQIDLPIYEDLSPDPEPEIYDWNSTSNKASQMHLISLPLQDLLGDLKPFVCSPPPETKTEKYELGPETTVIQELVSPWHTQIIPKPDALTPPDSPKEDDYLLTSMLDDIEPELCNELEELVRMHAENLVDNYKEETPSSGVETVVESNVALQVQEEDSYDSSQSVCMSSPSHSVCMSSPSHSVCMSSPSQSVCMSSPSYSDSCSSDPEWMPSHSQAGGAATQQQVKKRRNTKPYSRPPVEDKKLRKKEQNKNAATRYRLKKKAEIEEILYEEKGLQDKNDQLHHQVVELAREIKYLKSLMRDVFKKTGHIK